MESVLNIVIENNVDFVDRQMGKTQATGGGDK